MKRILLFASACAAMMLTSCVKDQLAENNQGDSSVTFTVHVPAGMATKAIADGMTVDKLLYEVYTDTEGAVLIEGETAVVNGKANVTVNLVKNQTYNFIFWAQAGAATCFGTEDLRKVTVDYSAAVANDETLDAFYAVREVVVDGPRTETVKLYRPFAQVNFGTTAEDLAAAEKAGVAPVSSAIAVEAATTLNTLTGEVDELVAVEFADNAIPAADETLVIKKEDGTTASYKYMATSYVLVGAEKDIVDATATITLNNGTTVEVSVPNLPVQRNYRTNIVGNILTNTVDFDIEVDPDFGGEYGNADALKEVLANGGEYTLLENVALDENYILAADVTINLNGYTLSFTGTNPIAIRVNDGATLTINGDGTFDAGDSYVASANAGGTINVNGGTYNTTNATLFQANGGKVYINGGTFNEVTPDSGRYYTLNHMDSQKNNGLISVTAGTFVNYNPAVSMSENPAMNFCAEGYTTVYDAAANAYTVVAVEELAAAGELTLQANLVLNSALTVKENLTINLNGYEIVNNVSFVDTDNTTNCYAIVAESGELNINGPGKVAAMAGSQYDMTVWAQGGTVNIYGGEYTNLGIENDGSDCIYTSKGGKVNIYGGTFSCGNISATDFAKPQYSILNEKGNNQNTIFVYGGTFVGFNPADNYSENPRRNFCAEGYYSYESAEGVWTVAEAGAPVEVADETALMGVLVAGGVAVLAEDVTVNGPAVAVNLPEDQKVYLNENATINLNGKTLTYAGGDRLVRVNAGATLTIEGEGNVQVTPADINNSATAGYFAGVTGGDIVVNGGNFVVEGCTIFYAAEGFVTINGGTFQAKEAYTTPEKYNHVYTLNCQDSSFRAGTAGFVVNGGSFYKFNPADNASEGAGTNYLGAGAAAAADGDWFVVTK